MNTLWFIIKLALFIWVLFWVLKHIRVVVVQEATAVAFKYLGRFVYKAMEWKDHQFDSEGSIVEGNGPNHFGCCWCIWKWGGWVFYISPLVRPARYGDTNEEDGFGEGIYVKLNDITPEPNISSAETTEPDGASVPLNIKFVCTMRVVTPYKWLFVSPKNATTQVTKRLDSILRAWVKSGGEQHAQSVKGNGEALWVELIQIADEAHPNALNAGPTIKKIEDDWGLRIMPNSIIAQDIGYDPEYQQAMQAKSKADLMADGDVQATAGRVIKTVAESAGITVEQLKTKLSADPTLRGKSASEGGYKEAFSFAEDIVKRDRAPDLADIRIGNVDGTSLSGNLSYLSVGGGGGTGVLMGGKKDRRNDNRGGKNNRGNGSDDEQKRKSEGPTDEDYNIRAQAYFDEKGVYPVWDPLDRQPVEVLKKRF